MSPADATALHALVAAVEVDLFGHVEVDDGHVATVCARPGFSPDRDGVVVETLTGDVVAWAWVDRRSEVYVHPRHRRRGLGAGLLGWVQDRARDAGGARVVQTVPEADTAAVRLLRGDGFDVHARAWLFGIDTAAAVATIAAGVRLRALTADAAADAHRVTMAAFADWGQRPMDYSEWAAHTLARSTFHPEASAVAVIDGEVAGALVVLDQPGRDAATVESLAVAHRFRRRGVARALLTHAFAALWRAGCGRCTVWTHSATGAREVYVRAGMAVERSSIVFAKDLTA